MGLPNEFGTELAKLACVIILGLASRQILGITENATFGLCNKVIDFSIILLQEELASPEKATKRMV